MNLTEKKFQRKKEDFTCENCGEFVLGDGYTNHCPKCLWSKHVDINPGDRKESCGGMMEPIKSEFAEGEYYVIERCKKCAVEKRFKMKKGDNFDQLIEITKKSANIE